MLLTASIALAGEVRFPVFLFAAFDICRVAFRAAKIGANTFEFLAALVAFVLVRFHAAFKLYSK